MVTQPLRPLTISELLDRTFSLYRARWLTFVGIAALPNAVVVLMQLFYAGAAPLMSGPAPVILALFAFIIVATCASMIAQAAGIIAVAKMQRDEVPTIGDAFRALRGRVATIVLVSLVYLVRIVVGLVLLVVPGVIQGARYALAVPAAALEGTDVGESQRRSRELTQGHLRRIFVIYILFVALIYAGTAMWQIPVSIIYLVTGGFAQAASGTPVTLPMWVRAASILGSFVVGSLLGPLMAIGIATIYYDERIRKEGFDLQHMIDQLDAPPLPSPPLA
jgi:hypothetical protein